MKSRCKNKFLLCLIFLIHHTVWAGDSLKYGVHTLPLSSIVSIGEVDDAVLVSDHAGRLIRWSSTLKQIVAMRTISGVELLAVVTNAQSSYFIVLAYHTYSENGIIFLFDSNLTQLDSQIINSNIIATGHIKGNAVYIDENGAYFEWTVVKGQLEMICEISHRELIGAQTIVSNGTDSFIVSNTKGQIQQWTKGRNNDTLLLLESIDETESDNFIYDIKIKAGLLLLNRRLGYELRNMKYRMIYNDFPKGAYTTFSGDNEIISISNNGEIESVSYEYNGNFIVGNKGTAKVNFYGKEDSKDSIVRNSLAITINAYNTELHKDSVISRRNDVTGYNFNKTGIVMGTNTGEIDVQSWFGAKSLGSVEMVLDRNRVVKYTTPLQPALEDQAILLTTEDSVLYGFFWPKGYLQLTRWPNRMQIPLVYDLGAKVYVFIQDSIVWFENARSALYPDGESNTSFIRFKTGIVKYKVNFEGKSILIVLADGTVEIINYAERTKSCIFVKFPGISELETLSDGFIIRFENGDLGIVKSSCMFEKVAEDVRDISMVQESKNIFVSYSSGYFNYLGTKKKLFNKSKIVITQTEKKTFKRYEDHAGDIDIFYVIPTGSDFVYYTSNTNQIKTTNALSDQVIISSFLYENDAIFFGTRYGELVEIPIPWNME